MLRLRLQPATQVIFSALSGVFFALAFPGHENPENLHKYSSNFLHQSNSDRTHHWVKAVDKTGKLVGVAQWDIYRTRDDMPDENQLVGPPSPGYLNSWLEGPAQDVWKDREELKQMADGFMGVFLSFRRTMLRQAKGPVVCLSLMAVQSDHQRSGVGQQLMMSGINIADEIGAECLVEASAKGRGLYEKFGFEVRSHGEIKPPKRWEGMISVSPYMMFRPAQTGKATDQD